MKNLNLSVLAILAAQACQLPTIENASPTYREAFFADEQALPTYFEAGQPEGMLELDSAWIFLGKDSVEGIERGLPEFQQGESIILPHRMSEANHSLWYRKEVSLKKGILVIDADDGAQLWANEVRIPRAQEGEFFRLASEGNFRLTIRAVNNAMAGGLRKVRWISSQDNLESQRQKSKKRDSLLLDRKILLIQDKALESRLEGKSKEEKWALLRDYPILITEPVLIFSASGEPFVRWISEHGGKAKVIFEDGKKLELESADGVFTLDLAGNNPVSFRILQNQSDFGSFEFSLPKPEAPMKLAIWGDAQGGWETFGKLSRQIAKQHAHLSIGAGDLVGNGSDDLAYPRLLQTLGIMQTPQLLVPGNHDYDGNYDVLNPRLMRQFLFRNQDSTFGLQVFGPLAILTLDPNAYFPVDLPKSSNQRLWFEQVMESETWQKADWRMVVLHQPPYSQGWPGYHGEISISRLLEPYFHRGMIDLVVAGHTHDYERLTKEFSGHPVRFFVVGGAGGGLEPEGLASEFPIMDKLIKQHHFGILEIKKDEIDWKVFGLEEKVLDHYNFKKSN